VRILTEPRNALTRQYQRLFTLGNAEVEFTPAALEAIAEAALKRETGVRALRGICEDLLLDLLFELPSRTDTRRFVVTDKHVRGETPLALGLTQDSSIELPDVSGEDDEPLAERESA
jgi:ATP-dependent Clp protease ATP-binding subunit ClpX